MARPAELPRERPRPRVSVIIPTWNGRAYIGQTLASVAAQRFRDFEVVVVDDGSTDGTREVVEPYLDFVRFVEKPHGGISAARNFGVSLASGELLAFLDHDDCWEPDYLEKTVCYLAGHPEVGVVVPGYRVLAAAGTPTPTVGGKKSPGDAYSTRSLLEGDVGTIRNPVMRRAVFDRVGGYDESIRGPEDCDLWLALSIVTEMHHLSEPLLLYRRHPGSFSRNYLDNARQWLNVLEKFERLHPALALEHGKLLRSNRAKQLKRLGRELILECDENPQGLREARRVLYRSIAIEPFQLHTHAYAVLASLPALAPWYCRFRRWELATRDRLFESRLVGWLSRLRRRRWQRSV